MGILVTFLDVLFNPILPVFAILALGYILGYSNKATTEQARTINWAATTIFLPILVLNLVATAPIDQFSLAPLLSYLFAEGLLGGVALWLAFRFGLKTQEAILMAIGSVFVNNAFFVLPISQFLYGAENIQPIIAIITLDTIVLFVIALLSLEYTKSDEGSSHKILTMMLKLPLVQAIAAGLVINLLGIELADSIQTFVHFNGAAAAPLALLALGIMLSQTSVRPDKVVWVFTVLKILVFPLFVWAALSFIAPSSVDNSKFMLSSAGPITTAMFSFAMLYGVPATRIGQVLVMTTGFSLLSLAVLA